MRATRRTVARAFASLAVAGVALALVATGCGGRAPDETAAALAVLRPHASLIDAFGRWTRSVSVGDTRFGSRAALEEAAFAPVRGEADVVGAWIERLGPDPDTLSHPHGAAAPDAALAWRRVRDPVLGTLELSVDPTRVLVRVDTPAPDGGRQRVTLAFAR